MNYTKMFFLGDKVMINKYFVKKHIPPIDERDDDIHTIIDFEWYEGEKYYVLDKYKNNFFITDELLLVERFDG